MAAGSETMATAAAAAAAEAAGAAEALLAAAAAAARTSTPTKAGIAVEGAARARRDMLKEHAGAACGDAEGAGRAVVHVFVVRARGEIVF